MPDEKYSDRRQDINFASATERSTWFKEAKDLKMPFAKYILEMARRGRERELARPAGTELAQELSDARGSVLQLEKELADTQALLSRAREEIFRLRHSSILQPGESPYSEDLVSLLQRGGVFLGPDILRKLGIRTDDSLAVQIVFKHLQLLAAMGLVREESRGWRWIG
jgi:hypothetical protein